MTQRLENLYFETKKPLAHALSNAWVQNFLKGFVFAAIALLVAAMTSIGVKVAAITFALVGTLALWLIAALIIVHKETPPETETHGVLVPANKPMPPNPCEGLGPPDAFFIFLGNSASFTTRFPHTIIRIGSDNILTVDKKEDQISVSARVFSRDGRIVAAIKDNEFFINPNNYFRRERPDPHTLVVYDQMNQKVLDVEYLNSRGVRFLGVFNHPNRRVVISSTEGIFRNTICTGESGQAEIFFPD